MKKLREARAITLVVLVITIIIMAIIAAVTISVLTGNGIVNKATKASTETQKQTAKETMNLKITEIEIASWTSKQKMPTLQEVADNLCEDDDMEYVELKSKKSASLDKITLGENTSIFTKLKKYPYEFEINSSLQLASIDGKMLASSEKISEGYILPSGEKEININENGTTYEDVSKYANVKINVNVPSNAYSNLCILVEGTMNSNYTINTNNWLYTNDTGISLDTTARGDTYFYFPFTVDTTGEYLFYMNCSKNEQHNNTTNPLKYGISSSPVTSYKDFDILNNKSAGIVNLVAGTTYYVGAENNLSWNYSGYSRVTFDNIFITKVDF